MLQILLVSKSIFRMPLEDWLPCIIQCISHFWSTMCLVSFQNFAKPHCFPQHLQLVPISPYNCTVFLVYCHGLVTVPKWGFYRMHMHGKSATRTSLLPQLLTRTYISKKQLIKRAKQQIHMVVTRESKEASTIPSKEHVCHMIWLYETDCIIERVHPDRN